MLPIRCFTCNKVLGRYNEVFEKFLENATDDFNQFFESMEIRRYCCKKIFMTHIDIFKDASQHVSDQITVHKGSSVTKILKAD